MNKQGHIGLKALMDAVTESHIASQVGGSGELRLTVKVELASNRVSYEVRFKLRKKHKNTDGLRSIFARIEDAVAEYNARASELNGGYEEPMRFKVGDHVAFVNRVQDGHGTRIDAVDLVAREVRTDGFKWWSESCFMPYEEWEQKHGKR